MADRLIIDDAEIVRQIQEIADQEHRSIEDVVSSMLAQYRPQQLDDSTELNAAELARRTRLAIYERARRYWREEGDLERAGMTDDEMDEQFWLFDAEGIPRLTSERNAIELPASSLHHAGQVLASAGFRSGQSDISTQARHILDDEYADYLMERHNRADTDDDTSHS
jgi:hypothetical protein